VKLSWLLGNNLPVELYAKNLVGEISERSLFYEHF
jgi:hypothetical protein